MKNVIASRRAVLKTISLSGLVFCGLPGLALGQSTGKKKIKHWDVIVAGGGPGGVPAAVAGFAGRAGCGADSAGGDRHRSSRRSSPR